jgi:hypothetical protein
MTASHRPIPRWSANGLGAHGVTDGDHRELGLRTPAGGRRSTPDRWCPCRRGRWRTRRSTGRCRWLPDPISSSHQPGPWCPGPLRPAAGASPVSVAHQHRANRRRRATPRLVGDRHVARMPPPSRAKGRSAAMVEASVPHRHRHPRPDTGRTSALSAARIGRPFAAVAVGLAHAGVPRRPGGAWGSRAGRHRCPVAVHGAAATSGHRARTLRCPPPTESGPDHIPARGRDGTLGVRPRLPDPANRATPDVGHQ